MKELYLNSWIPDLHIFKKNSPSNWILQHNWQLYSQLNPDLEKQRKYANHNLYI